jgi:flagellar hook-associated protein 2
VGISSSGIGSGLDVEGLISKLMAAEAAPLDNYDKKAAAYQAKLAAYGKVNSAVGSFQAALTSLNSSSLFKTLSTSSSNEDVLSGSAGTGAVPGKYKINVTQLAQAQSLSTGGRASTSALIGSGAKTTLTFQFGSVTGGTFGVAGNALGPSVASSGIASGSLTVNGTAIATNGTTHSARDLADAINDQSDTTGVTAKTGTTATAAGLFNNFGNVAVASGSYTLSVGGVDLATATAGNNVTAASIDSALGSAATKNALAAANITVTGTAAAGNLQFLAADGSNISVTEAIGGGGSVTGGIGHAAGTPNAGSSVTATAGVTLSSTDGSQIIIGGSNPAAAGLSAGSAGSYLGAGFSQDGSQNMGTVTLDAKDQSLQGIRDAINKANIGVTATIVSDGSANPYHLVIASNKTGEKSTMKISVGGDGGLPPDPAIASLLGYDPAGSQSLTQTSGAQDTKLTMNGIEVSSKSTTVTDAIQGVSLDVSSLGSSTLTVSQDTKSVADAINGFVKAYNDLNKTISSLTAYNPDTKKGDPLKGAALVGDASVHSIQAQLRRQLGATVEGLGGKLTNLSQVGIAFDKDGSLKVDSTKLNNAIANNFGDIGGLFAAMGTASDGNITFDKSTAATKPGEYGVNITKMAAQGSLTGASALASPTKILANTTWAVTLNQTTPPTADKVQNIAIPAGSYDNTQLAAILRAAINGNTTFSGSGDSVETSVDASGKLTIASSKYGELSSISIASVTGTPVSDLFGGAVPTKGNDVEGTIGGVAAAGNGQTLTAAGGSPAEGIQLTIKSGATGDRGTITFSQGYAYQLTNLTATFTGKDSILQSKTDGLNVTIRQIADQRDKFSDRLTDIEKRYRKQFTALDTMLQSMQSTQSYLSQQLAALAANAR